MKRMKANNALSTTAKYPLVRGKKDKKLRKVCDEGVDRIAKGYRCKNAGTCLQPDCIESIQRTIKDHFIYKEL